MSETCNLKYKNWGRGYSLSCIPSFEETRESAVCYDKPRNAFLKGALKMWLAHCERCAYDGRLERSKIRGLLVTAEAK